MPFDWIWLWEVARQWAQAQPPAAAPATPEAPAVPEVSAAPEASAAAEVPTAPQHGADQTAPAGAASPAAPTGNPGTAPAEPACTPSYSYTNWVLDREERWYDGQWVLQRLHYSRTRTNTCDGSTATETRAEGPKQLWQAVPDRRVAEVNRPVGDAAGLTGAPLRSSELPAGPQQAQVGPQLEQVGSPGGQAGSGFGQAGSQREHGGSRPSSRPDGPGTAAGGPASLPPLPGAMLMLGVLLSVLTDRRRGGRTVPGNGAGAPPLPGGTGGLAPSDMPGAPALPDVAGGRPPADASGMDDIARQQDMAHLSARLAEFRALVLALAGDPARLDALDGELQKLWRDIEQLRRVLPSGEVERLIQSTFAGDGPMLGDLVLAVKKQQYRELAAGGRFDVTDPQFSNSPLYRPFTLLWPALDPGARDRVLQQQRVWQDTAQYWAARLRGEDPGAPPADVLGVAGAAAALVRGRERLLARDQYDDTWFRPVVATGTGAGAPVRSAAEPDAAAPATGSGAWLPNAAELAWVQRFFGIAEEGYGPETRAAVARLQREYGIEPDPQVMIGPRTIGALLHQRYKDLATGRRDWHDDDMGALLEGSQLPAGQRSVLADLSQVYARYILWSEIRYQGLLRLDAAQVANAEEQMAQARRLAAAAGELQMGTVEIHRRRYEPALEALRRQAGLVADSADDGEYARLLAMLDAAKAGNWDGVADATATTRHRLSAWTSSDAAERAEAGRVLDLLSRADAATAAAPATVSPNVREGRSIEGERQTAATPAPFLRLQMPMKNARLNTEYGVTDDHHPRPHKGIDIESASGNTDVMAAADGRVVFAGDDHAVYGNMVIIQHDGGYLTLYAHLEKISVSEGQDVGAGAVIGVMGNTGLSDGAHLHFELRSGKWENGDKEGARPWASLRDVSPWSLLEAAGWGVNFRRLLEDSEFTDTSVTLAQIRNVLRTSATFRDYADGTKLFPIFAQSESGGEIKLTDQIDVAQHLYDEANKYHINPLLLLTQMQKEQSLLRSDDEGYQPPDSPAVVWALGVGAYDGATWNPQLSGLKGQISAAARTLRQRFDEAPASLANGPQLFDRPLQNWGAVRTSSANVVEGHNVTIVPGKVGLENRATWALYAYTPHIIDFSLPAMDEVHEARQNWPDTYRNPRDFSSGNVLFVEAWQLVKERLNL